MAAPIRKDVGADFALDLGPMIEDFDQANEILMRNIQTKAAKKSILKMRRVAVDRVHVVSGRLRQSLESTRAQFIDRTGETTIEYGIGTALDYAIPEEYGVGVRGDPGVPHVPKTRWVYFDREKGQFRTAYTRPGHPYLRPALEFNQRNFEKYLAEAIEETHKELNQ